eukprot:2573393-Amphidinium_carterae.1
MELACSNVCLVRQLGTQLRTKLNPLAHSAQQVAPPHCSLTCTTGRILVQAKQLAQLVTTGCDPS